WLNVFRVELPSLASTPERLEKLAPLFAAQASLRQGREYQGISVELGERLRAYSWPANIRVFKNFMYFAVPMSSGSLLPSNLLPPYLRSGKCPGKETGDFHFPTDYHQAKAEFERRYLQEALRRFEGKINLTSRKTGLSKVTLIEKVRRYEINVHEIKYRAQ